MKSFFVVHRSPHHAKKSGYERIVDYYPNAYSIEGQPVLPYKIAKILTSFSNQKAGLYNSNSLFKDIEIYNTLRKNKGHKNIVHFLNAERDVRFAVKYFKNKKSTKFCGTFHKPVDKLKIRISNNQFVKYLDGAIAVGVNQVDYIKEYFKIDNVVYIPHGVDTTFFNPELHQRIEGRLLFVGQHLRDFEVFNKSIPRIAEKISHLSVHVVIHPAYKKFIKPHPTITVFSNLSDIQLKNEYNAASLLFLPLKDATACNSILEAMACGLPIITSDVGGTKSYLDRTNCLLLPQNETNNFVDATVNLLKNELHLNKLSDEVRQASELFDWKLITEQITNFHKSLHIGYE